MEEAEVKKTSKLQTFLYVFLIPFLFLVTVAMIVLTVAGVNVFEASKTIAAKLPYVSTLVTEEESKSTEEWEKELVSLEAEIKDREAEIEKLEEELKDQESNVERSNLEKEQLQNQIDELTAIQEENKRAFKDIIKTYETMSAKKAAPIISAMSETEAIKILTTVKADTLAAIMENMSAEDAARYTELLTAESDQEES